MKAMFGLTVFFAVLFCLVSVSSAGLTQWLPESSHFEGRAYSNGVRLDFAVYDTELYPDEFTGIGGYTVPGENPGRFIYAYQLFNENPDSEFDIEIFTLLGIGEGAIESPDVIGTVDDGSGSGVDSSAEYFNVSRTTAIWEFEEGALISGKQSVFLVLSSDHDYGTSQVVLNSRMNNEASAPLPEPATMLMLGSGAMLLLRKRRSFQSRK